MNNLKILKLLSVFLVTIVTLSMNVFTAPISQVQAETTSTNTSPAINTYAAGFAPIFNIKTSFDGISSKKNGQIHAIFDSNPRMAARFGIGNWTYPKVYRCKLDSLVWFNLYHCLGRNSFLDGFRS